jgi:hypothetical protein
MSVADLSETDSIKRNLLHQDLTITLVCYLSVVLSVVVIDLLPPDRLTERLISYVVIYGLCAPLVGLVYTLAATSSFRFQSVTFVSGIGALSALWTMNVGTHSVMLVLILILSSAASFIALGRWKYVNKINISDRLSILNQVIMVFLFASCISVMILKSPLSDELKIPGFQKGGWIGLGLFVLLLFELRLPHALVLLPQSNSVIRHRNFLLDLYRLFSRRLIEPIFSTLRFSGIAIALFFVFITAFAAPLILTKGDLDWIQTLNPYVGPSLRLMNGGVPLIDVFCQYGLLLPYLIFSAAFSTIIAPSYPSAEFVVSLVNASYLLIAIILLMRILGSMVLLAMVTTLISIMIIPAWTGIPQFGGLRFLPPLLVAAGIVFQSPKRHLSLISLVPLLIASFWSAESLIWGLLTFVCGIGGRLLYERAKFREFLHSIGGAVVILFAAHLLFSIGIRITAGAWPRYDIYLEILNSYRKSEWGNITFSNEPVIWVAQGLIYLSALAAAFGAIFQGQVKTGRTYPPEVYVLLPITVAGILGMSYWVARCFPIYLYPTMIPAVIIATVVLDRFLARVSHFYLVPTHSWLLTAIIAGIIYMLAGTVAIHARENSGLVNGVHPRNVLAYIRSLQSTPNQPDWYDPITWDTVEFVKKYQPDAKELILFTRIPRDTPTFLLTRTKDALGTSSQNEALSKTFVAEILERVKTIAVPGRYIFVDKSINDFLSETQAPADTMNTYLPMQLEIYKYIRTKYNLCVLEESPNGMLATVVQTKTDKSCNNIY